MKRVLKLFTFFLALGLFSGLYAENDFAEEDAFQIEVKVPEKTETSALSEKNAEPSKSSQIQGKFLSYTAMGIKEPQEFLFQYNRLQLEYSQVNQNLTFFARINARYNTVYENDLDQDRRAENLRFDLTEAYAHYETYPGSVLTQWDFRIGQQIINWGKADEMRPTDILSPQDLTLLLLEKRIDRKLGRFALKSNLTFGEAFRLEALLLPLQRATQTTRDSKSPFTVSSLSTLTAAGYTLNTLTLPEKKLGNSDVALKLYTSVFNTDVSFSFYNGYDPLPFSKILPTDPMNPQNGGSIEPFLSRITFWGFDFERAVAGVVIRGEAAYFTKGMQFGAFSPSENPALYAKYAAKGSLAEKDLLDLTLGLDKTDLFTAGLYVNLQYSLSWVKDYEEGLKNRYGTRMKETNHMGIWSLSYDWGNLTYRLELSGNYSFTHGDGLLNPTFQIKIGPETKMILGAYLFFGKKDTLMGQYHQKDYGYLQLEHLF